MHESSAPRRLAVVGAGAMGRGIAQISAVAGCTVTLYDAAAGAADRARDGIRSGLDASVARGKVSSEDAIAAHARVRVVRALAEISEADLVIEAVVEDLAVKQVLFRELEDIVSPDAVLASNTSSLSIGSIAAGMRDRGRLIGLHFFNPVPAMKLVEIVLRPETPDAVSERALAYVAQLGKDGVVVSDSPGFLVNLAGRAYVTEALAITRDGIASVPEIDRIAREVLGFPLGPFELMDLTGIDVNYPVTANLFEHNFADPRLRSTWQHRYLLDSGNLGRKTGSGFYAYPTTGAGDFIETGPGTGELVLQRPDKNAVPLRVRCAGSPALEQILVAAGVVCVSTDAAELSIIDPLGEDVHTAAAALGLDPLRTIAIDTFIAQPSVLTLMAHPGADPQLVSQLRAALERNTPTVLTNDSPGFITQRLLAAVVNLGCEIAQRGVASPEDIDRAVRLGLRYPRGPLEWADAVGGSTILHILEGMLSATGDPRYRPSAWLSRRASTGLSCLTEDFVPAARRNSSHDEVEQGETNVSL